MTEYRLHWLTSTRESRLSDSVTLEAETARHGAALALRHFIQHGCEISTPLAHLDVIEPSGHKHTFLVDEVLAWLHEPKQASFVTDEQLGPLLEK